MFRTVAVPAVVAGGVSECRFCSHFVCPLRPWHQTASAKVAAERESVLRCPMASGLMSRLQIGGVSLKAARRTAGALGRSSQTGYEGFAERDAWRPYDFAALRFEIDQSWDAHPTSTRPALKSLHLGCP